MYGLFLALLRKSPFNAALGPVKKLVRVIPLTAEDEGDFIAAAVASRALHGRWVTAPGTPAAFRPMHVSLLGAPAVVQVSNPFAHLIQQPRRTQGWQRVGLDGPQCCARLRRTRVSLRHRIVLAAASHRPACVAPKGLAQWLQLLPLYA